MRYAYSDLFETFALNLKTNEYFNFEASLILATSEKQFFSENVDFISCISLEK